MPRPAMAFLALSLVAALPALIFAHPGSGGSGGCPFHAGSATINSPRQPSRGVFSLAAFNAVDFDAVKLDIQTALTDSQPNWPADFDNYGPFMVRLAWHCAGTYRTSDGRGGCDGARQRFSPEHSWDDNTNLDKARALLAPIKAKHGAGLSWGDLIMLAGTEAIKSMGGPVLGFCGGRIDDADGSASIELGPTEEQQAVAPCAVNGNCTAPLGSTTVGLIYVNPEGPMGNPIPAESALQIRDTFGRMGLNDSETVALIGGGHAFGKVHGACPTGPGPNPDEDPTHPWPGTCGDGEGKGKGNNTFTSGFEGSWTTTPVKWSNAYFTNLLAYDWSVHVGPGGHHQWQPKQHKKKDTTPVPEIMMLTSDVALINDPVYLELVNEYAADAAKLDEAFASAWYKMASRDMGPVTRCLGDDVPPAQPFQYPLPAAPKHKPDYYKVRDALRKVMNTESPALAPDTSRGTPSYAAVFATLAWQCASTFRATDYLGGCNGARIRFAPQKDWPENAHLDAALSILEPIKAEFGASLSWADLIVLAGQSAIESAGGKWSRFCGGRTDATDGNGSAKLAPRTYSDPVLAAKDSIKVMGLSPREFVALAGNLRSPAQQRRLGYSGSWTEDSSKMGNAYFKVLLEEEWEAQLGVGLAEYKAVGKDLWMMPSDIALKTDPELLAIVTEYATDHKVAAAEFVGAWSKMMNADRFDGPVGNVCDDQPWWAGVVTAAEQAVVRLSVLAKQAFGSA